MISSTSSTPRSRRPPTPRRPIRPARRPTALPARGQHGRRSPSTRSARPGCCARGFREIALELPFDGESLGQLQAVHAGHDHIIEMLEGLGGRRATGVGPALKNDHRPSQESAADDHRQRVPGRQQQRHADTRRQGQTDRGERQQVPSRLFDALRLARQRPGILRAPATRQMQPIRTRQSAIDALADMIGDAREIGGRQHGAGVTEHGPQQDGRQEQGERQAEGLLREQAAHARQPAGEFARARRGGTCRGGDAASRQSIQTKQRDQQDERQSFRQTACQHQGEDSHHLQRPIAAQFVQKGDERHHGLWLIRAHGWPVSQLPPSLPG